MSYNFRPHKPKKDFWATLNKALAWTAKQVVLLAAFISEVLQKLIAGAVVLLGSNSFSFFVWATAAVVSLYFSITGFPEIALIFLRAVGVAATPGLFTGLLLFGAALNYVQLQPRLWRYWTKASFAELSANPDIDDSRMTPVKSLFYSFDLAVKRKNKSSERAYFIELAIYVLTAITVMLSGVSIGAILLFLLKSACFLWLPENFMAMAFAMRVITKRERNVHGHVYGNNNDGRPQSGYTPRR